MTALLLAMFWASALLLVHVYVGYPLCMWLMGLRYPREVCRGGIQPTVTVILAVHNGAEHVGSKLANLAGLNFPHNRLDVVVVCDGCEDASASICKAFDGLRVRVLEFAERRGKAACLNDAVAVATGDVLLMTDVRQQLNPEALRELVANLADPAVGAVSGELSMIDVQTGFARGVDAYWKYEKFIRRCESRSDSTIGVTGALYVLRRDLFRPLPTGTVLDDVLIPMRVAADGWRVIFEPRALAWDRISSQPASERQRKIRTLAGNYQLVQLAPWLVVPYLNRLWFRFVSHKLLRLIAPWLMMVLVVSAAMLTYRNMGYAVVVMTVIAGMCLVLLGRINAAWANWLPIRLATAFWYLNIFAAEALVAFARNRRLHLW